MHAQKQMAHVFFIFHNATKKKARRSDFIELFRTYNATRLLLFSFHAGEMCAVVGDYVSNETTKNNRFRRQ